MKISTIISALLLITSVSHTQETQIDVNLEGYSSFGSYRINDLKILGTKPVASFNYSEVGGSPFRDEKWNAAILFTSTYNIFIPQVKLNFHTGEIWYKNENEEMRSINSGTVKKVIFFKGDDTTHPEAKFIYLQNVGNGRNHYFQVLSEGKTQLFKLDSIIFYKMPYDVLSGKQEYRFLNHTDYYLFHNGTMSKLRNLNKEQVFEILQPTPEDKAWLKQNNNNRIRNETDLVLFMGYYNYTHKDASPSQ